MKAGRVLVLGVLVLAMMGGASADSVDLGSATDPAAFYQGGLNFEVSKDSIYEIKGTFYSSNWGGSVSDGEAVKLVEDPYGSHNVIASENDLSSYSAGDTVNLNVHSLSAGKEYAVIFEATSYDDPETARNLGITLPKSNGLLNVTSGFSEGGGGYYSDDYSLAFSSLTIINQNTPPQFNSSSVSPDPLLIGETADFGYDANDPDGSIQSVELVLKNNGTQIFTGSKSTSSGTFSPSVDLTQGDLKATFTATDDAGATTTETIRKTLSETTPVLNVSSPQDRIQGNNTIEVQGQTQTDDNKPGEDLDISILLDGSEKAGFQIKEGDSFQENVTGIEGNQTLKVVAEEKDGDASSVTREIQIDTQKPDVNVFSPSGSLSEKRNLELLFSVSDQTLDSSSCEYSKDGGARFDLPNCQNASISFDSVARHNVTVFADDIFGREGSASTTFSTDFINNISLTDKISGAQIQGFKAVFSSGDDVVVEKSSGGQLKVRTSDLPRGDVSLKLEADGYKIRNESLDIDDGFELRKSFDMKRASVTIQAFSERDAKSLKFNFSASNGSTTFEKKDISMFQKEFRNFNGFPTGDVRIRVQDVEGEKQPRTYFADIDENAFVNLKAFLLEKSQGIRMTAEIRGSDNQGLNNAEVSIQRNINNSFRTVSQGTSASDGSVSFFLSPDSQYRIFASHPGFSSFRGSFSPANYQFDPLIVQLGREGSLQESTIWDRLEYELRPQVSKLNESGVYSFNFSVFDPENGVSAYGLRLKDSDGVLDQKVLTGSPSGGSVELSRNVSSLNVSDLRVEGFFVKDSQEFVVRKQFRVVDRVSAGRFSLKSLLSGFERRAGGTSVSLLALIFTLVVSTGVSSRLGAGGGGVTALLVLGVFVWVGWIHPYLWSLALLTMIGFMGRRG